MSINSILYLLSSAIVIGFCVSWMVALIQWLLLRTLSALNKESLSRRSSNFWFTLGVLPLSLGSFLILFSVVFAWLTSARYLYDHCLQHQGHPHLCFSHISHNPPGGLVFWGILSLGLVVAFVSGTRAYRLTLSAQRLVAGAIFSQSLTDDRGQISVLPSALPAAFTAGLFAPRSYLTFAAMGKLSHEEMSIVLSHELEHARNRDPLRMLVLRICESWLPGARLILRRWEMRREVECDSASIRSGFRPTRVAQTILKLQEALTSFSTQGAVLAYSAREICNVEYRVQSLLSGGSEKNSGGHPVLWVAMMTIFVMFLFGHDPIHHILESFLGWLS
jgi:Zn-dependent protease with chaperone function